MRRNFRLRSRNVVGPALLAVAVLGASTLLSNAASGSNAVAEEKVRAAFTLAMRVDQGVQVPPVARAGDRAVDADLNQQLDEGSKAIHSIFADEPAARVIKGLNNAIQSQRESGDHFRILGAGVGQIKFDEVTVDGSSAKVHATVETWCRTQVRQRPIEASGTSKPAWAGAEKWVVSEPHNLLDVTASLTEDKTGHWVIADYAWRFASGSGP